MHYIGVHNKAVASDFCTRFLRVSQNVDSVVVGKTLRSPKRVRRTPYALDATHSCGGQCTTVHFSQKNDKVQKLEDECDWYRKEALRLDSFNTAMKKDLKYMKGKLEILGGWSRINRHDRVE